MIRLLFLLIASLGLLSALGTVLARNLIHAALYLVAFFFVVACQFLLLEAEFLAAIQVLVYIGAVAILILFGIMLTRNIQGDETTGGPWYRILPGAVVAGALLVALLLGITRQTGHDGRPTWTATVARPGPAPDAAPTDPTATRAAAIRNMTPVIGAEMMTRYVVAFEVAGLLLTAAVVGAIALAMGEPEPGEPTGRAAGLIRPASAGGNGEVRPPAPADSSTPTDTMTAASTR